MTNKEITIKVKKWLDALGIDSKEAKKYLGSILQLKGSSVSGRLYNRSKWTGDDKINLFKKDILIKEDL